MGKRVKSGGRQKGTPNKLTGTQIAVAKRALAEGITPLEVMIENMRHFRQVALDAEAVIEGLTFEGEKIGPDEQFKKLLAEVKKAAGFRQMAQDCARDASPYTHAKLSSIELKGDEEKPIVHKTIVEFVRAPQQDD